MGFLAFDFDAIASLVDTAVAGASAGVQGFGNVFESVFEDIEEIPEQYAFFLKDKAIDVATLADKVFSADAIQGIPEDVAAAFESGSDQIEAMFGQMLNVPSMALALADAGVNVGLMAATAEIADLFTLSSNDIFFNAVDFASADVAAIQKAVASMDEITAETFATAMESTRDGADVAVGAAWNAVLASTELSSELNANGVNVAALSAAAQASIAAEASGTTTISAGTATAVAAT